MSARPSLPGARLLVAVPRIDRAAHFMPLLPIVMVSLHHAYFGIVSSWPEAMMAYAWFAVAAGSCVAIARFDLWRLVRAVHTLYAVALAGAIVAANLGWLHSLSSVRVFEFDVAQAQLGVIPSMASVAVLIGIPLQRSWPAKTFAAAVVVANMSITGWLGLPIAFMGWRGIPYSAVVYMACVGVDGDPHYKTTSRVVSEMATHRPTPMLPQVGPARAAFWPFWMADLTAGVLLIVAIVTGNRGLLVAAGAGFRFGSGLWLHPLGAVVIALAQRVAQHQHAPQPHQPRREPEGRVDRESTQHGQR
jgi:hypothetical protein